MRVSAAAWVSRTPTCRGKTPTKMRYTTDLHNFAERMLGVWVRMSNNQLAAPCARAPLAA